MCRAPFFQDAIHRTPINPRTFESNDLDLVLSQPIIKGKQIGCHRRKALLLPLNGSILLCHHDRYHDRFLMNVKSCTSGIDYLHGCFLALLWDRQEQVRILQQCSYACSSSRMATILSSGRT